MFRLAAKALSFLWKRKRRALTVALLALLFFALRLPWTEVAEKIVRKAQSRTPRGISFDFENVRLKALPPGLVLEGFSLRSRSLKRPLLLDSLSASAHWGKWLALKKAWAVRGQKKESSFSFSFWRAQKKSEGGDKIPYMFLEGAAPRINMSFFQPLWPKARASGRISFRLQYEGAEKDIKSGEGALEVKGSQIKWSQAKIETRMGDLELPPLAWSEGRAAFRLKEGDIIVEALNLGSPSDSLHIQMRGNGEIRSSYKKFRLGAYDFQIQIEADNDFPLSFLDLMLSGAKEELEGRVRYRARITGSGSGPPDIEKLSKF